MNRKIYILDTNVILSNANSIYDFKNSDIMIAFQVLEEIDKFKSNMDTLGFNARCFIKTLDSLRKKGNIFNGVRLSKKKGMLYIKDIDLNFKTQLNLSVPDNRIIAIAQLTQFNNQDKKVIVVSNDINVRVKCDSLGIPSQDYNDQTITKRDEMYKGFCELLVDDQIIDRFYSGESIFVNKEEKKIFPNQFVMLISNQNDKHTALAKFVSYSSPLHRVNENKSGVFGLKSKNKEQLCSLNLLMDPKVPIVSLSGVAGSGKTVCALAAGLEQTLKSDKSIYKRLIVIRPVMPLGKDLGFLPGSIQEKLEPWLMPIVDNLKYLFANDKMMLDDYIEKGIIEICALTYIRGRSISDAFIIVDEAQNLSLHEIKTILTRVGMNAKIVFTGDTMQVDALYLNEMSCGLTHVAEKFKEQEIAGHITLQKGERSLVATIASKLL